MKVEIQTKITIKELYEFTMNHNYKSFHGMIGVLFSIASAVGAVIFWDRLTLMNRILILLFALMFTVLEPLGCYLKVRSQIKKNFQMPLKYIFDKSGLTIVQGENKGHCAWHEIMKITSSKNLIHVYTSPVRAFILPKKDIGEQIEDFRRLVEEKSECLKVVIK